MSMTAAEEGPFLFLFNRDDGLREAEEEPAKEDEAEGLYMAVATLVFLKAARMRGEGPAAAMTGG